MISCLLIDKDEKQRSRIRDMLVRLGVKCSEHSNWPQSRPLPRNRYDLVMIGNPAREDYALANTSPANGLRHKTLFYFDSHPNVDVISELIVKGATDILVVPFDLRLLEFKLVQSGFRLHSVAA